MRNLPRVKGSVFQTPKLFVSGMYIESISHLLIVLPLNHNLCFTAYLDGNTLLMRFLRNRVGFKTLI